MSHPDRSQFKYVAYISATPQSVWNVLTSPEATAQYWAHRNESDWKAGSRWFHKDAADPGIVDVVGQVLESDPPRKLVLTWQGIAPGPEKEEASRVTLLIEPVENAVRLTVAHEEMNPAGRMFEGVSSGWPLVISNLKTFVETGKPMSLDIRPKRAA
jgi:uncharacterized protein YndB with AHSA1/START domain